MTKSTPKTVKNATETGMVDPSNTMLLGTFGPEGTLQALLRYPDGQVAKLSQGDMTRLGRVLAIGPRVVHIDNNGRKRILRLRKRRRHPAREA